MSKKFILVSDGMDADVFKGLQGVEEFEVHPVKKVTPEEYQELLPKVEGLVIRSASKVLPETLEKAVNLKYVIRAGEGTDNIDKAACEAKGVKVSNTPGANANSAAEHAIALMMTVLRNTAKADASMKAGKWEKSKLAGMELWNKKVGIVGFGKIAQLVAKRISGFEPQVMFFDPFVETTDIPYAKKADSLEKIFSECDIITIHLPLMDATKGMINSELLNMMKQNAILINASRGKIVDEEALYNTLKEGKIAGAGFDVFANEPLEDGSKLRELDNLVMTPHLGASTAEASLRVGQMAAHQLQEFFLNGNLLHEVKSK
ncbi:MAG: hydroxyacid dehydrogenase [Bacteriovoracaceae bacterium]|nr:hydroxyacid dehydrogenase [Bacteriovoracaceae bacterium]